MSSDHGRNSEEPVENSNIGSSDAASGIAQRRIAQITAVLGLDPGHFERGRREEKSVLGALDNEHNPVLMRERRQINEALVAFTDHHLRACAVEIFVALAFYERSSPLD